ncbi:MAG: hypothetical protein RMK49_09295 [Abditibacteriales bacterium]|nr:hypothetical protein [Abditibacteriales bacterium]
MRRKTFIRCFLLGGLFVLAWAAFAQQGEPPKEVTLRGRIRCAPEELKRLYGADVDCRVDGHQGVLRTADGSLYTMLPNVKSYVLLLEPKVFGREVEIKGRLFPKSMMVEVATFKVFDEKGKAFTAFYWCDT